jgi:hypothetical protein
MLYGLQGLAAKASDLVWIVLRKEPLGVFADEGVTCNETIESGVGYTRMVLSGGRVPYFWGGMVFGLEGVMCLSVWGGVECRSVGH